VTDDERARLLISGGFGLTAGAVAGWVILTLRHPLIGILLLLAAASAATGIYAYDRATEAKVE
jgi:hypothetical protein